MPSSRRRGFITGWKPHAKTLALIDAVQAVLTQYVPTYGPMTIRQIFYRLVATASFEKSEQAYERLIEAIGNARRARLIPFSDIRDDGDAVEEPAGWDSIAHFSDTVRSLARNFALRGDIGQPVRTILIVEAAGMAPQVARVCSPYGVEVRSAGGFDGLTGKYGLAENVTNIYRDDGRPTRLLHVGDYDPSGTHIYSSLIEDIEAFVGDTVDVHEAFLPERIALTEDQIARFALPVAPAKVTDRRSFHGVGGDGTSTVQCEALSPANLAQIVETAIRRQWSERASASVRQQESVDRERLVVIIDELLGGEV